MEPQAKRPPPGQGVTELCPKAPNRRPDWGLSSGAWGHGLRSSIQSSVRPRGLSDLLVSGAGAASYDLWNGMRAVTWVGHSPREQQAQEGAEEDQNLVEHGRLCPQDGPVEVILWDNAARHQQSPGPTRGPGREGLAAGAKTVLAVPAGTSVKALSGGSAWGPGLYVTPKLHGSGVPVKVLGEPLRWQRECVSNCHLGLLGLQGKWPALGQAAPAGGGPVVGDMQR